MKKVVFLLCVIFAAFLFIPAFAQDVGDPGAGAVGMGFGSLAAMVAIIPFVTEIIKKGIPNAPPLVFQIISWVIGFILALIGWHFKIGFLAGTEWYIALLYGLGAGLIANGIFDTGIINGIFGFFSKE